MKVNIICSDGDGWIYGKFVRKLADLSKHAIEINSKNKCDVVHFIPYYEQRKVYGKSTAWFSHMELKEPLKSKFVSAAKEVNHCISHSQKYYSILTSCGIQNVSQIMPGVDLNLYTLRTNKRNKSSKLVVGFVGRHYTSSNRKNPVLLKKIGGLPFVDLRISGGKVKEKDMPDFYRQLDVVISPATIEGGPMCITESLAQGIPIVCYESVGVANEFDEGVLRVPFGREDIFIRRLEDMWKRQDHINIWRDSQQMERMRAQVADFTWESFVKGHDEIWSKM